MSDPQAWQVTVKVVDDMSVTSTEAGLFIQAVTAGYGVSYVRITTRATAWTATRATSR